MSIYEKKQNKELSSAYKQLEACKRRISELDTILKRLYEDNVFGKISDERFNSLTAGYEEEHANLKKECGLECIRNYLCYKTHLN